MNEQFLFNASSVVVDNIAESSAVYDKIGTPMVWEGRHPFFETRAVMHATQKGGTLLIENAPQAHAAVARCATSKERNFHINLLVDRSRQGKGRGQGVSPCLGGERRL